MVGTLCHIRLPHSRATAPRYIAWNSLISCESLYPHIIQLPSPACAHTPLTGSAPLSRRDLPPRLTTPSRAFNIILVADKATLYIAKRRRTVMINLGKVSVETKGFKQSKGEGTGEVVI
jgi:hypothetical protein